MFVEDVKHEIIVEKLILRSLKRHEKTSNRNIYTRIFKTI